MPVSLRRRTGRSSDGATAVAPGRVGHMRRPLRTAALGGLLALVAAAPAAAKTDSAKQLTFGDHYDRNPVVVQDGKSTLLLFARSQDDCNRLDGCNADNTQYDLYMKAAGPN